MKPHPSRIRKNAEAVFDFLASVKLAVPVVLGLTASLIAATFIESLYDTATAQYWVYRSFWFRGILTLLGVNILVVALSRWPWKKHHSAFLIAHLGILMILAGAFITQRFGLDGSLRLQEGETGSVVEVNEPVLVLSDGPEIKAVPVEWIPPGATFRPFDISGYPLRVEEFLPHADPQFSFIEAGPSDSGDPALQLKIEGGPMRIVQDFWLWGGEASWANVQAGPATLRLVTPKFPRVGKLPPGTPEAGAASMMPTSAMGPHGGAPKRGPVFTTEVSKDGKFLNWEAQASDGKIKKGSVELAKLPSAPIETGWKGNVLVSILKYIPHAATQTAYVPARVQYGQSAPPAALRLKAGQGSNAASIWLGLGDRAVMTLEGHEVPIGYYPRRVSLPFSIKLDHFNIERYEGTHDPKEYSSDVRVIDRGATAATDVTAASKISMNEPLHHGGITFYQASYEDAQPRPTVSIFSVNRDPGRELKYWGSLLLVFGCILLFARNYWRKRGMKQVKQAIVALVMFGGVLSAIAPSARAAQSDESASPPLESRAGWNFNDLGMTPTHTGGRLKPIDSFAREVMLFTTGSRSFQGWDPVEFVVAMTAQPQAFEKLPFISIAVKETRRQLGLNEDQPRFSPEQLLQDSYLAQYAYRMGNGQNQLVPNLSGGVIRQDPREQEMKRLVDRLGLFRSVATGEAWLLVPKPQNVNAAPDAPGSWKSIASVDADTQIFRDRFAQVVEAYKKKDQAAFESASLALRQAVEAQVPDFTARERGVLKAEMVYNRAHPFLYGWILYLIAALLWVAFIFGSGAAVTAGAEAEAKSPRWASISAMGAKVFTGLATVSLLGGIVLRCYIAGRPPVSNMYESIIWVSFGVMLFGALIYRVQKQPVVLAVATGMACFGLIAADAAPAIMDPGIHPLVPVLRSNYWLTIHVLTITLGYAAFALTTGLGNVTLWQFGKRALAAPGSPGTVGLSGKIATLNQLTYRSMQFGVVLLAAGTILGGIWADYSWGRFWGWDPKEVWALIALLGYVAILHARYTTWVGQFGYAAWTVISFMLVVMAWYGVNFVLGVGLHSYGFSAGGRGWVAAFCAVQMTYVGVIAWLHNRKTRAAKLAGAVA